MFRSALNPSRIRYFSSLKPLFQNYPESQLFSNSSSSTKFNLYKPGPSFLAKSINNPDEPIIYLHDFLTTPNSLKIEANDIAQTLETPVYCPQLRNHGTKEFQPFDMNYLVEDLINFVKQQNLGKVILIGEGLGGKISMITSLLNEIDISKLVILESLPQEMNSLAKKNLNNWIDTLYDVLNSQNISKFDKDFSLKITEVLNDHDIKDSNVIKYLLSTFSTSPINKELLKFSGIENKYPINYIKENNFVDDYASWNINDKQFLNPAMFIFGRDSMYLNNNNFTDLIKIKNSIEKYYPNYKLRLLQADHFVRSIQSNNVVNAVSQFLLKERNPMYDELRGVEDN